MDKKKGATTNKNDSDFELLKVWQDNPDLEYYLSENHWNYHVNQLLYAYLTSRYEGNEVGVYINLGLLNGSAFKIDYNQIYGVMFNEAYSFCSYVLTTPVPETKITLLESKAESLCSVKLAKPIIAYNILVMTGLILCFSNVQNEAVGRFLRRLSGYNHTHYFGDGFHHFENYIKIGLECVAGIMIDGQIQSHGKLRPGYDYKGHDEYLRKTLPWYRIAAEKFEKRLKESEKGTNSENIPDVLPLTGVLNTNRAHKYFKLAIKKGWMKLCQDEKFEWLGVRQRPSGTPNISELAYFCGKVWEYKPSDCGNCGKSFPDKELEKLFGVNKLNDKLLNVYKASKVQAWRQPIDDMFDEITDK